MLIGTTWKEDQDLRRWVDWAISLIGSENWATRREAMEAFARPHVARAYPAPSQFNYPIAPEDRAGWYLYQSELYLTKPYDFDMVQCSRILPFVTRLGARLDLLRQIPGATARMQRALAATSSDIDSILFELVVASDYATRGFDDVEFILESPGRKTPDIKALRAGHRLFVETKRKRKTSDYATRERERWWRLSARLRKELMDKRIPVVVDINFHIPLPGCPDDYLDRRIVPLLRLATYGTIIDDKELCVSLKPVALDDVKSKLRRSLIRIDSSALYQQLYGGYDPWRGITGMFLIKTDPLKPRYVSEINFAAGCVWSCDAPESTHAKAQHFRRQLADAVDQLPPGEPAVVHLAFEAYDGEAVEATRYERLKEEMIVGFDPGDRDLEVIYCNLFQFEVPPNENWAVQETCSYWLRNSSSRRYFLEPTLLLAEN